MAVMGSIGTVTAKNVVHASLFLMLALLAVAGIFILLLAEFLALVQVLIYGGAITILLLFALMLTRARENTLRLNNNQMIIGILASIATFTALTVVFLTSDWSATIDDPSRPGFKSISEVLFQQWAIPFEIASLVLLVALIGSIVISRPGTEE